MENGRIVLVTGAAKRIGRAIAIGLQIAGFGFRYQSKVSPGSAQQDVEIHWSVLCAGVAALIGLACWLSPGRSNGARFSSSGR